MLSRKEQKLMQVIFRESQGKCAILLSPFELIQMLKDKTLTKTDVEKLLTELSVDGYFDIVYSDRHGQVVYCITLLTKGKNFMRDQKLFKRNLIFRLALSVIFAFISFIIGLILKKIF